MTVNECLNKIESMHKFSAVEIYNPDKWINFIFYFILVYFKYNNLRFSILNRIQIYYFESSPNLADIRILKIEYSIIIFN